MKDIIRVVLGLLLVITPSFAGECVVQVERAVMPHYPHLAIALNETGKVTIEVRIDQAGIPIDVKALTGPKYLARVSETAAGYWRFSFRNIPVGRTCDNSKTRIFFNFSLLSSDESDGPNTWSSFTDQNTIEIRKIKPKLIDSSSNR